jgi:hypothetical protein
MYNKFSEEGPYKLIVDIILFMIFAAIVGFVIIGVI